MTREQAMAAHPSSQAPRWLAKFPGVTEPRTEHPRGPRHPWHLDPYAQADYCGRCCVYLAGEAK